MGRQRAEIEVDDSDEVEVREQVKRLQVEREERKERHREKMVSETALKVDKVIKEMYINTHTRVVWCFYTTHTRVLHFDKDTQTQTSRPPDHIRLWRPH